jgi:hypothetical protein
MVLPTQDAGVEGLPTVASTYVQQAAAQLLAVKAAIGVAACPPSHENMEALAQQK